MTPEWITAIAACVSAISIILVVWQVKVNFDRARREQALNVISRWDKSLGKNTFRYANFIFELPSSDVQLIYNCKQISIKKELAEAFFYELSQKSESEGEMICLPVELVVEIRLNLVNLLNSIEDVALAYKHGVADKQILHEAYYNFLIQKGFLKQCQAFMKHFGSGAWPALHELQVLMNRNSTEREPAA